MPYTAQHKDRVRQQIVEKSRVLFNRHGIDGVSIDTIMAEVGLTRGGFYNHFSNKEELFAEAVLHFLNGQGAVNRKKAGVNEAAPGDAKVQAMLEGYLGTEHLADLDGQCPMIAMPTDVSRTGGQVQDSYQVLFQAMTGLFQSNLGGSKTARADALTLSALCVGGMVLAKTLPDEALGNEVRDAAHAAAQRLLAP